MNKTAVFLSRLAGPCRRLRWLHLALFWTGLTALDLGFRAFFRHLQAVSDAEVLRLLPFTLGWALLFTAAAALFPPRGRRIFMAVLGGAAAVLAGVHGFYISMFRSFFSFAAIAFSGDGAAFMDLSYLMIRPLLLLWLILCLGVLLLAALAVPDDPLPRGRKAGLAGLVLASVMLLFTRFSLLGVSTTVIWDDETDPAFLYEDFSDSNSCMTMLGLYQYTFRDIQKLLPLPAPLTPEERAEIEAFAAARSHKDNGMSGLLEGKNLILVQLEAIDTWMLDYMPALRAVKENSLSFSNHYTPAYITAGTFNTEFIVNNGLLPATGTISMAIYSSNTFPNSLATLFREKGYTANSFHGSEGNIYNRTANHANWGYQAFHSGTDMGMADHTMDSQLVGALDRMTAGDPFFSFVITYSGHGPYGEDNPTYLAHREEALRQAGRTDGNYVYAAAHAMETDLFVKGLMEGLEHRGLLDDTVVVFYADHYNYYMLDDALCMDIKGVDELNLLQRTDFFIYSRALEAGTVEKYTSSVDVLPTLANLFGLDAQYELLTGHDAFSDEGGHVFFSDNSWTGRGEELLDDIVGRRRINNLLLSGNYWAQS